MNNRKNKHRILALQSRIKPGWQQADREWFALRPVGREFGSPDFERLWAMDSVSSSAQCQEKQDPPLDETVEPCNDD